MFTKMTGSAASLSLLLLVATTGGVQAAFPNFTNLLLTELAACVPAAQSDVQCLAPVSFGLQRVQTVVIEVHNISSILSNLGTFASATNSIASAITSIPVVGQMLSPVALVISGLNTAVDVASRTVGAVDSVTWRFKPSLDSVLAITNRAMTLLNTTATVCINGRTLINRTRSALTALPSGAVRGNLTLTMETFSASLQRPVHWAVQAMSESGSACASLQQFVSRKLPNTTTIKEAFNTVSRYLDPIAQKLNTYWNKDYCLPFFKIAKDDAELSAIADLIVQRKIVVRSADGADFIDITTLKSNTRELQKLRMCINLQNITHTLSGFSSYAVNAIYKLINATLSELRVSAAPGLPSLTSLQDFATGINNQLNIPFNVTIITQLNDVKFDCPSAILNGCASARPLSLLISTACDKVIG